MEWCKVANEHILLCLSVFPNVPQAPGLSCDGEDRKYLLK